MTRKSLPAPSIYVLAGTNGAGKSSIGGAAFRAFGGDYVNPDEVARRLRDLDPELPLESANSRAWLHGRRLLEAAIAQRKQYAFETTLGGDTITALLEHAHHAGLAVRIWYVGLDGVDLHIARVKERVKAGGHDIPVARIRERYDRSRQNLIRLLPSITELYVYDNSAPGNPERGETPAPRMLVHVTQGEITELAPMPAVPSWAKPIVAAALKAYPPGK